MKTSNIITLLLWVVGIIIGVLAIAGITAIAAIEDVDSEIENVNIAIIAMLVLLVFMGIVSLAVCFMNKRESLPYVNFITANYITAIFQLPCMTKNEKDSQEDTKKTKKVVTGSSYPPLIFATTVLWYAIRISSRFNTSIEFKLQ